MTYFEFYGIEPVFFIDESGLKKAYYEKMRSSHPDMHAGASVEEQTKMLEESSFNNKAYKTLRDFHSRLKYIVETFGSKDEQKLPGSFLMEMMDINESIMDVKLDPDEQKSHELRQEIDRKLNDLFLGLEPLLKEELAIDNQARLEKVEEYLLKRNYFLRLLEQF